MDYLSSHPETAQAHSTLKRRLAAGFPDDRFADSNEKEAFIRSGCDRLDVRHVRAPNLETDKTDGQIPAVSGK